MTRSPYKDFAFGEFRLSSAADTLFRNGDAVALEPRPLRVLQYLVERGDRVVSKEELLDNVWPDVFTTEGVLKKAVSQVRRALGDDASEPRFVETYHGRGYRFVMPVIVERCGADADHRVASGNLPARLTAFLGRSEELRDLTVFLRSTRVLTLTGTGGIGKTSLALELARGVTDEYPGGIWLVELGDVPSGGVVAPVVAAALGLREANEPAQVDPIVEALGDEVTLLVFDNCEHVVDRVAGIVEQILRRRPLTRVLATSRAALGVAGEAVWAVPPLDSADASAVFAERARLARPGFALTESNAETIRLLCERVEGNPLAIELAAARLRALSLTEIIGRLDDRLDLLVAPRTSSPARHRTLRATIEWSYALLDDDERWLLNRLSVFAGPWTLDAAEALAEGAVDVLDVLARLVDKSLISANTRTAATRYAMLDSIRAFAHERLVESGAADVAVGARRSWALGIARRFDRTHFTTDEVVWLDKLTADHASLRAAWQAAADSDDAEGCAVFAGCLWLYWEARGHWAEGRSCLDTALRHVGELEPELAAAALYGGGMFGCASGDLEIATERLSSSLEIMRATAADADVARAVRSLGTVFAMRGMFDEARSAMVESEMMFRQIGEPVRLAWAKGGLAWAAMLAGDLEGAAAKYEESIELLARAGIVRLLANALHNLADIRRHLGDTSVATELMTRALGHAREADERRLVARSLHILGTLAIEREQEDSALEFLREAFSMQRRLGDQSDAALALEAAAVATARSNPERTLLVEAAATAHRETHAAASGEWDRYGLDALVELARASVPADVAEALRERGRSLTPEGVWSAAFGRLDTGPTDR